MEAKYIFRNELRNDGLSQYIRKMLEINDPMNIEGLCRDSGCSCEEIRSALALLVQCGEVERLRPANRESDDMDFFRLPGPFRMPRILNGSSSWFAGFKNAAKLLFDEKEEDMEHNRNKIITISQ